MALSDRKKRILRAIVETYIATAEPVGSKAVAELAGLDVSTATIRNEMAVLRCQAAALGRGVFHQNGNFHSAPPYALVRSRTQRPERRRRIPTKNFTACSKGKAR